MPGFHLLSIQFVCDVSALMWRNRYEKFIMVRSVSRAKLSPIYFSIFTFSYERHPLAAKVPQEPVYFADIAEIGREYCNKSQEWSPKVIALWRETLEQYPTWMVAY